MIRLPLFVLLLCLYFSMAGCTTLLSSIQLPVPLAPQVQVEPAVLGPTENQAKYFLLTKIVTQIPTGDRVLNLMHGWGCLNKRSTDWRSGKVDITDAEISDVFRQEFIKHNYKVAGDSSSLFSDATLGVSDLIVAGAIEQTIVNVCFPFSASPNIDTSGKIRLKGSSYMKVRWQIYSLLEGKVVLQKVTEGSFVTDGVISGSIPQMLLHSFRANTQNLIADPRLSALATPPLTPLN